MEQTGALVKFDEALDALDHIRRRKLLLGLLESDSCDDPRVVTDGSGDGLEVAGGGIAMWHTHLPKLAEYGFVEWDRETNEVRRGPDFVEIRPMLELLDEHADDLPEGWS